MTERLRDLPTRTPGASRPALVGSAQKLAVRALRTLTTPLLPEDYVDLVDPLRSVRYLRARVIEVRSETSDADTIVLKPGRGWLGHVPGQFVRIGVDIDGIRLWRAYSVTSGPRADGHIAITVKAQTGGVVSAKLHDTIRVGDVVELEQADGAFTWAGGTEPVLFITGGSGITPVMGMLRHRVGADQGDADVVVVHSEGHPEDVIFADEIRELAATGAITLLERHTQIDGRLDPAELDSLVPDWRSRTIYACGPAGMLRNLREFAAERGVEEALHTEDFVVELAEPGEGGTLHLDVAGEERDLEVSGDTSILDAAEAADILMPSGCRMGICYGCVRPLISGSVRDMRTGEVTTGAAGDGVMVQTCISSVAGECSLG